jgi:hypothetical protein
MALGIRLSSTPKRALLNQALDSLADQAFGRLAGRPAIKACLY